MNASLLNTILDAIPIGIQVLKAIRKENRITDFEYLIVNNIAKKYTCAPELTGKTFLTLHNDRATFDRMVQVTETGISLDFTESMVIKKEKRLFHVQYIKSEDGVILSHEDITTRNSEEHLHDKNNIPEAIYNAALTGLQVCKSVRNEKNELIDFEWVYATKFSEEYLKNGPLAGKRLLDIFPALKTNGLFDIYKSVVETGETAKLEIYYEGDGLNSWFSVTATKHYDGFAVAFNDITERLKNQQELKALNAELKTFNTVASKDYKETIQILYTNLEYIVSKEAHNLSNAAKANIRRAQSAIQRMKLLTDDINIYLQLYDCGVNKSVIDPNAVLKNLLSEMKEKIDQVNAKVEPANLPAFYADPLLFSQLLANLIDNSLKFRKLINSPVIKIKHSQADEINAIPQAMKNTRYNIVSVSDNGIGFTEKEAQDIFELFFRLQDKNQSRGSGIGLAICRKIMAMHEGFITAEGIPGVGSVFNCYFPIIPH